MPGLMVDAIGAALSIKIFLTLTSKRKETKK
jgi:hypothetical protein